MNIIKASVTNFTTVTCVVDNVPSFDLTKFYLTNGNTHINSNFVYVNNNIITILLSDEINIKFTSSLYYDENTFIACDYVKLFSSAEFNSRFFTLDNLGLEYTKGYSEFRLWSPPATSVNLLLYRKGISNTSNIISVPTRVSMAETSNGIWYTRVDKDLNGFFYTFEVAVYGNINEAVDPYAKAVAVNGTKGAIIDLKATNPPNFNADLAPTYEHYTDAIIYELSIRDMSTNPNSNITKRGKFLGLTEANTKTKSQKATGIDYLKELGITHVQLMPVADISYMSIDEENPTNYNWGYDPQNYNVPEGSYSSNPYSPECRIKELKELIACFHKNGICVNMDVVYNHIFHAPTSNFELIFPGYYFRHNEDGSLSNGTGCGNDIASENLMMKRFIIDSVLFWQEEYHMDGFRFDLMGIIDIDTINTIKHKLGKHIMVYGEGWNLSTSLPASRRATILNSKKMLDIGFFNDIIRDVLKGNVFSKYEGGFISGKEGLENGVMLTVTGCINYSNFIGGPFASPIQSINYIACHDNSTLWDKLSFTNNGASEEERISRVKLAIGILLTCQGIPLIASGMEFLNTKNGIENSYKSPDYINWMDWDRKDTYEAVVNYTKSFINLRKRHPAFRMCDEDEVRDCIEFLFVPSKNVIAYVIKNNANRDAFRNIVVVYNANNYSVRIQLPPGNWTLISTREGISDHPLGTQRGLFFTEGISVNVLYNNY